MAARLLPEVLDTRPKRTIRTGNTVHTYLNISTPDIRAESFSCWVTVSPRGLQYPGRF